MKGPASTALLVLDEHFQQIKSALNFLSAAQAARKSLPAIIHWDSECKYEVGQVKAFLDAGHYPERLHCNANYLSSVAAFEQFLREVLEACIRARVSTARGFDELTATMQDSHMKATGRLLTMKSRPPQQLLGLDFFEVCRRIGTCLPGAKKFEFNAEALCLAADLLEFESFFETLNDYGYPIGFDRLGADGSLRTLFRTSGTRETSKALEGFIAQMTRQRNRIAHTGTSTSELTPALLDEHITKLAAIAKAIDKCLK